MSKFKFINIIDAFFIALITMLIIFAWIQFFIKNIILSLIISSILSLAIIYSIYYFRSKKQTKALNISSKNTSILKFKLAIQTLPHTKFIKLIKQLIPTKYETRISKGDIIVKKEGISQIFTTNFNGELTESKLLEIIKTRQSNNITVFCLSFDNSVKSIHNAFKNKTINLVTLDQLYNLFEQNNISVDTSNIDLSKHKITLVEILKNSISRNKSRGYFVSGLVLLFASLIIPYKIYYVVFSTILLGLSLVCRLKPNTISPATSNIID